MSIVTDTGEYLYLRTLVISQDIEIKGISASICQNTNKLKVTGYKQTPGQRSSFYD